ncbi:PAAR-like domain-containing protein [Mesorhizobium calcicola]|uniref:PAAR-like domain-containing protein n=1 Tax=Mesorhizobium calcicola TaxID=1300310 RepID=A0ABW4WFG0_9HYPH
MTNTVFAEGMGFFHKGSPGKGIAPGDVCLTPPPPPGGPAPIPYVNVLSASDLTKGSKSVKFDGGNPTALENASEIATSTGNEAGTQGGGVVTHKTKGKGVFKLWSFVVKVEGKGVGRHGDMMAQNTASDLPNCIDAKAVNNFIIKLGKDYKDNCPPYDDTKHRPPLTDDQYAAVRGKPCWECASLPNPPTVFSTKVLKDAAGANVFIGKVVAVFARPNPKPHATGSTFNPDGSVKEAGMTPDHQPPLSVAWKMGGCKLPPPPAPAGFKQHMSSDKVVKPHCSAHARSQGKRAAAAADAWDFAKKVF